MWVVPDQGLPGENPWGQYLGGAGATHICSGTGSTLEELMPIPNRYSRLYGCYTHTDDRGRAYYVSREKYGQIIKPRKKRTKIPAARRQKVFERDKWRCQLCGEMTDRSQSPPEPLAPTIDHKVPYSKGGTNASENLQCAHYICNIRKADIKEAL